MSANTNKDPSSSQQTPDSYWLSGIGSWCDDVEYTQDIATQDDSDLAQLEAEMAAVYVYGSADAADLLDRTVQQQGAATALPVNHASVAETGNSKEAKGKKGSSMDKSSRRYSRN